MRADRDEGIRIESKIIAMSYENACDSFRGSSPLNIRQRSPVPSLLIVGPTGVGKSPLGETIAQNGLFGRRCHHLDFGSELRNVVSGAEKSARYTAAELDFLHGVLERGLLLENEHFWLAQKIIALFLERVRFSGTDVLILNGIPRHRGQARDVAGIAEVLALIVLDCSAEDVFCRIRDNVGRDRTERVDDAVELIAKKLELYRDRTAPLIDYYEKLGVTVYRLAVHGSMTPQEAYGLLSALAAAHPPVALVAEPPER
jgi:adenylate kinase family enzyme